MTFKKVRLMLLLDGWEESQNYGTYFFNKGFACITYNPHARPVKRASFNLSVTNTTHTKKNFYKNYYKHSIRTRMIGRHSIEDVMKEAGYV